MVQMTASMRHLRRSIPLLVLALARPTLLSAQRYNFKYYSHSAGLGGMDGHSLLQDRTGFIWIGTSSGLYRYDGLHFRGYTKADGLPDNWIESLHQTASGIMLVGTERGLARRDGETFKPIPIPAPAISSQQSLTSDRQGHRVTSVQNGREALAALEQHSFDLVLMDIQMPEMDGIEAALLIREREKRTGGHIPILAMTAHAMRAIAKSVWRPEWTLMCPSPFAPLNCSRRSALVPPDP
jgi:CheY-like chemotaxis protein